MRAFFISSCAILLLAVSSPFLMAERVVHVAVDGVDTAAGSAAAPVASLERARDLLRGGGSGEARRMVVHAGTHFMASALELNAADSGLVIEAAAGEARPVISGGARITGWKRQPAESAIWTAPLPEAMSAMPKLMRVGDDAQTLARTPNFDAADPVRGGWLFTDLTPRQGKIGEMIGGVHTRGDWLEWDVEVPETGEYTLWMLYSADNTGLAEELRQGRMSMAVKGGETVVMAEVPDTGSWADREWHRTGVLKLPAGFRTLRWTNLKGGGMGWDAFALTRDADWKPDSIDQAPTPPADGAPFLLVQAEGFARQEVKELMEPGMSHTAHKGQFLYREGDLPAAYPLSPEPRLHMFPAWGWVNTIVQLDSVDPVRRLAQVKPTRSADQEVWPGNRYFVANIREGLDAPGEWWPDPAARALHWIPRSEADTEPGRMVVVAVLDRLINIVDAEGVRIRGLEFRDTDYSLDVGVYMPNDAVISLSNARDCVVEGNRFYRTGGYAVRLTDRAARNEIVGNEIAYVGQGGVILENSACDGHPVDNLVAGNHMHHLGQVYKHVAGVYGITAKRTRIAHNLIEEVPRYGISFKSFEGCNGSHGNVAEYNIIRRTNLETNDSGAIETLGRDRRDSGNVIQYNQLIDAIGVKTNSMGEFVAPHMTWGVYLDDYSSGTTVRGNLIVGNELGGVCIHGGRRNVIEGNIIAGSASQSLSINPIDDFSVENRFVGNVVLQRLEGARLIHQDRYRDTMPRILSESSRNLYWRPGAADLADSPELTPQGNLAAWRAAGFEAGSRVADPKLNTDYRFAADSPAREMGFPDLPWEKMGLKGYERAWKGK